MNKKMNYILNEKQQEMVEQHLDLVSIIIHKYIRTNEQVRGLEYEDLYQYGCLALCKAAYHFDGRVKFATFAGTVIRNALLDECRKAKVVFSSSCKAGSFCPSLSLISAKFTELVTALLPLPRKMHG